MGSTRISRNIGSQAAESAKFRRSLQDQGLKKDLPKGSGVELARPYQALCTGYTGYDTLGVLSSCMHTSIYTRITTGPQAVLVSPDSTSIALTPPLPAGFVRKLVTSTPLALSRPKARFLLFPLLSAKIGMAASRSGSSSSSSVCHFGKNVRLL